MSEIKFALMGCGRISEKHASALKSLGKKGAVLVGVCDPVIEKARALGSKYEVPHFSSLKEMMEEIGESIDVINILTESGYHAQHCVEVASFNKHVVVEKPMALKLSDADKMISACDQAGVKLFVVKQNRYNLTVQKLRNALETGRFGKIVMGTVRVRWCRRQAYYDQDAWRGSWRLDGGVFSNQASHHVDLLQWMLGDVESVYAVSRTALVDIEAEDTGAAIVKFHSGAIGIIEATTATRPKDLEGSLSILGEKGSVEIGGFAVNKLKHWQFEDMTPEDDVLTKEWGENPTSVYGFGHLPYLENVINNLRSKGPALVDGLSGRKSLELISAIYESIETGREVKLQFWPKKCKLGGDDLGSVK